MGVQRDGSFAEFITMPIERIVAGRGLSADIRSIIEPFTISYHAVSRDCIEPPDRVLVIGAGPIGILAMISAKMHGATVYIADILDKRLSFAGEMGADEIINSKNEDLAERVGQLTDGDKMDVCIEAAGLPQTFLNCIENVCFGGRIILIGNCKKETVFNHSILLKKELTVYGSRNSLNDFQPLIKIVSDGKINLKKIITHTYNLEKVLAAFEDLKNNDGSMLKVLVSL